ncbi:hypothetical protein B0H17DRAFT_1146156 [Mycena rosella]|uniref:Uncharacterized protein n=1 Tax=Mycena rosella TaxID=1033263 RepID=A0AAD7CPI2_MYCRO|nr:hypothetical protein B0H17DRAFT_1146156 [Mycena rosella]
MQSPTAVGPKASKLGIAKQHYKMARATAILSSKQKKKNSMITLASGEEQHLLQHLDWNEVPGVTQGRVHIEVEITCQLESGMQKLDDYNLQKSSTPNRTRPSGLRRLKLVTMRVRVEVDIARAEFKAQENRITYYIHPIIIHITAIIHGLHLSRFPPSLLPSPLPFSSAKDADTTPTRTSLTSKCGRTTSPSASSVTQAGRVGSCAPWALKCGECGECGERGGEADADTEEVELEVDEEEADGGTGIAISAATRTCGCSSRVCGGFAAVLAGAAPGRTDGGMYEAVENGRGRVSSREGRKGGSKEGMEVVMGGGERRRAGEGAEGGRRWVRTREDAGNGQELGVRCGDEAQCGGPQRREGVGRGVWRETEDGGPHARAGDEGMGVNEGGRGRVGRAGGARARAHRCREREEGGNGGVGTRGWVDMEAVTAWRRATKTQTVTGTRTRNVMQGKWRKGRRMTKGTWTRKGTRMMEEGDEGGGMGRIGVKGHDGWEGQGRKETKEGRDTRGREYRQMNGKAGRGDVSVTGIRWQRLGRGMGMGMRTGMEMGEVMHCGGWEERGWGGSIGLIHRRTCGGNGRCEVNKGRRKQEIRRSRKNTGRKNKERNRMDTGKTAHTIIASHSSFSPAPTPTPPPPHRRRDPRPVRDRLRDHVRMAPPQQQRAHDDRGGDAAKQDQRREEGEGGDARYSFADPTETDPPCRPVRPANWEAGPTNGRGQRRREAEVKGGRRVVAQLGADVDTEGVPRETRVSREDVGAQRQRSHGEKRERRKQESYREKKDIEDFHISLSAAESCGTLQSLSWPLGAPG